MIRSHSCVGFFLAFLPLYLPAQEVSKRTLNNGNLVLEDIPEIPESIVTDLNRFQHVRSAPFAGWTLDGESLFITTRFGDVSQLHRVDMPGGARRQLTFFDEPVDDISRRPGSDNLAFSMDEGGSEFSQIYLLDTKNGESRRLTDGKSRNGGVSWSRDGRWLAHTSTRRNGKSNDVWVLDPDNPEDARLLLESPDGSWWGAADWTADGSTVLVQQYVSARDSRIYTVDVKSGERRAVEGSKDEESVNSCVGYDAAGKGMFFVTNQKSEFNQLAYRSFTDEEVKILTPDIQWNVGGATMSEKRDRLAFTVNEDGLETLYFVDPTTFELRKVEGLPTGLIGHMEFSQDGSKLGLTLNTAQSPSDSFSLELGEGPLDYGQLTRWTASEIGGLDASLFVEPELIRYETFDGRSVPAFVYKPKGEGPFPVVIYIHGGPEGQFRPGFISTFQLWADKLGAAVIAPNVRGSRGYGKEYINLDNGFKREDSVKDIGALLDWIAGKKEFDKDRVAVYGGSYGGYMVLASAVHYSDRLKAAVDVVGISNFVTFLENTQDYRRDLRRVEYGDERDPEMRAHLEKISPSNNVDRIKVPMLVIQGQNDPRVPVTEAEQIVAALRKNGKPVWYMNALNEGHGYARKENRDVYQQVVMLFLKENL